MFQPTTILALLALTTSTFAAPNDLEKRFQCDASVSVDDCTAKSAYFNNCLAKRIPAETCLLDIPKITAANPNPKPATPLEKRYTCLPSVSTEDCVAKSTFFNKCTADNRIPVSECFDQSTRITAKNNNPFNPARVAPVAPVPSPPATLGEQYQCAPSVSAEECSKRKQRYKNCLSNGGKPSDCYNNSQLPTESKK